MGASMALLIPTRPTESFLAGVGFFVGGALQHYLRRDQ